MKKNLISILVISSLLVLPVIALAQPAVGVSLDSLIVSIKSIMWKIFGIIAVIMFVVAAILFLTSQGNAEKIQAARSAFIWGVAGVVVGIIAFSIVSLVQGLL